jgi:uncharacterized membrane protein
MTTRIINYAGWAIVLSASAYFIFNNVFHYFIYGKGQYTVGGFWPQHAPWLLVHIVGGLTALTLGPFQFIPAIRKNYPKTHRTMGKVYLLAITVAACASIEMSIVKITVNEKAVIYGIGLFMLALVWLLTSSMAYWSVRSKNYVQHREWMVRSYVVTCAFTTFRLIDKQLTERFGLDPLVSAGLMAWVCWSVPLIVTEIVLQARKISKGNAALANEPTGQDTHLTQPW